ncbi:MAG: MscL family protein [Candidatus Lokiarchaeota archaeon]|nr:MscL family protein [Candidatus Lokiarchaeota archaeon]
MSKSEPSYEELLEEVKKIRELLTPPPPPPEEPPEEKVKGVKGVAKRAKKFGNQFVDFLKKYKVVGLAVAFIMAVYVGAVVNSVVNDLIFPLLEYLPGFASLTDETITWMDWPFQSPIRLGALLSSLVTFIIVALVIFIIVKLTQKIGLE